MKFFDWLRFPRNERKFDLAKRLSMCELVNPDPSTPEDRTSGPDKKLNFDSFNRIINFMEDNKKSRRRTRDET
jgi:hypothetical protein